MSKMENAFRTAMVGGFDRQDVLSYLERMGREHRRSEEGYRQTIKRLEEECAQLREQHRNDPSEALLAELASDREKLASEWAELASGRAAMEKDKALIAAERKALEKERLIFAEERASLLAERESLSRERRDVEFEHDRLSDMRRESEEEAGRIMADLEKRLSAAEQQYTTYVSGVEQAAAAALRELDAVRGQLLAVPSFVSALPFPALSRIEALTEAGFSGGETYDDGEPPEKSCIDEEAPTEGSSSNAAEAFTDTEQAGIEESDVPDIAGGINWAAILGPEGMEAGEPEETEETDEIPAYQEYDFTPRDGIPGDPDDDY